MAKTRAVLINPNLIAQSNDLMTTGIVYCPISLAYLAAALRAAKIPVTVVDAFGEKPNQVRKKDQFLYRGLLPEEVVRRIPEDAGVVLFYAINLTYHSSLVELIQAVRSSRPDLPCVIVENTQAVTAYSLERIQEEFYALGASYVICGEGEERGVALVREILDSEGGATERERVKAIDGIGFRENGKTWFTKPAKKVADLDKLPFPAWDMFPIRNYWKLGYAHGPFTGKRYLPLLTSRGCPYACRFCVIPETNNLKWRGRSAMSVVDEMEAFQKQYDVSEFHIEDVDPTVNDKRTLAICAEIKRRGLKVTWKVCAGTKVETIRSEETLRAMAEAGCRYISISPESGSPRVMKLINKPFDIEHAIDLIRAMNRLGIYSQACFVLGFPGEEESDRQLTREMARRLTKEGLDEIAIFIITPVPGSAIFGQFSGYKDYSQLNFSPTWRQDYAGLSKFRMRLYRDFLFWKLRYHPLKILKQPIKFLTRRFDTKMEMAPYRALHTFLIARRGALGGN